MTFYEMIEDMSLALNREKLVIFVGAGVSKNSGLPTWGQLVQELPGRSTILPTAVWLQRNISGFLNITIVWMKAKVIPPITPC